MPRAPRTILAGHVYHILNRGVRKHTLFASDADYLHFLRLMAKAQQRVPLRILGYHVMPNHWHFVVWPECPLEVPAYFRWLTWCHACHFNAVNGFSGHAYEGRYRAFLVEDERYLITLLRYVEGNAVRAGLVDRAEAWRWSSLHPAPGIQLADSPIRRPDNWLELLL